MLFARLSSVDFRLWSMVGSHRVLKCLKNRVIEQPNASSEQIVQSTRYQIRCTSWSRPSVSETLSAFANNRTLFQVVDDDAEAGSGGLLPSGGAATGGSNQSSENVNLHREQRRLDDLVFQSGIRLAQSTRKALKVTYPCH